MFLMNMKMAFNSLKGSKLRTFLTLLGIIIGVTSVVTFISFGEGLKNQITDEVRAFGNDFLVVNPGQSITRDDEGNIDNFDPLASFTAPPLSQADFEGIAEIDNISMAAGIMLTGNQVELEDEEHSGLVMATHPDANKIMGLEMAEGTFLKDDIKNDSVAVLANGIKQVMFGSSNAVGRKVQIKGVDFTVIGVLEDYQSLFAGGGGASDLNQAVFIPVEAGKRLNQNIVAFMEIDIKVADVEQIDQTIDQIEQSLISTRGSDDFTVVKPEEFLDTINSVLGIMTTAVTAIASISVLVGGIGIMNIMFVTVSERTREIGIRKAIGATNNQIMVQFLIEAIVITILGAAIGIGISAIISLIVGLATDFSPSVTMSSVIIATASSALFGVVFGIVPAIKAARKDPIESLRHE